jgi:hypothetical protein
VLGCRECPVSGVALAAAAASRAGRRALLQAPGAYGDVAGGGGAAAADPWGTAGGYYDPYGPGYIPGFINIDISQEYGRHVDVGPVAVDLTADYAGFAVSNAFGVGVARSGEGFDVQLGNGNIMDLSVTRSAGFGLWLLNGLVNINIGPDGRWNVATAAAANAAAASAASAAAAGAVTVQGLQDAASRAATAAAVAPLGSASGSSSGGAGSVSGSGGVASVASKWAAATVGSAPSGAPTASTAATAASGTVAAAATGAAVSGAAAGTKSGARKPCEGGVVVKVEGTRYMCKYKLPASGA